MNKGDIEIVIGKTPYEEWGLEIGEAPPISGAIMCADGGMCDEHVSETFPELSEDIEGLYEEAEGMLSYDGDLTLEELKQALIALGFDTTIEEDLPGCF